MLGGKRGFKGLVGSPWSMGSDEEHCPSVPCLHIYGSISPCPSIYPAPNFTDPESTHAIPWLRVGVPAHLWLEVV